MISCMLSSLSFFALFSSVFSVEFSYSLKGDVKSLEGVEEDDMKLYPAEDHPMSGSLRLSPSASPYKNDAAYVSGLVTVAEQDAIEARRRAMEVRAAQEQSFRNSVGSHHMARAQAMGFFRAPLPPVFVPPPASPRQSLRRVGRMSSDLAMEIATEVRRDEEMEEEMERRRQRNAERSMERARQVLEEQEARRMARFGSLRMTSACLPFEGLIQCFGWPAQQ